MKFQSHSKTSYAAAVSVLESADTQRGMVYRLIRDTGGATDESMHLMLGMNPSTQRPRRVELVELGIVRDSGLTAETNSGRQAVVWELASPTDSDPVQLDLFDLSDI
jgi:hypothetical protein